MLIQLLAATHNNVSFFLSFIHQ